MGIRSFFADLFSGSLVGSGASSGMDVNPVTGLPMTGGAVDVAGNPYGTDLRHHDDAASSSGGIADHHRHAGSPIDNDWSSSSWSGVSISWPDHFSSSSTGGGYDPSRGS